MNTTTETVTSADGTPIAIERTGRGAPVILIGGAFNDRSTVAALAGTLAPYATAVAYDRRGRGDSGDGSQERGGSGDIVEREVEDLAAVIGHVGSHASVFGHSSGAVLGLEAAIRGLSIDRLAVYEPPYIPEGSRPRPAADLADQVAALVSDGRRDDAAALFLTGSVGMPAGMVDAMQASDAWGRFSGLAHTLPADLALCGPGCVLPADRLAGIAVPTLAIDGAESWDWIRGATLAVADAIPGARYVTIEGHDHGVLNQPEALRPVLAGFLG
jgi:alpha-beta hydrolase superfamily lysophospholipase